MTVLGWSNIILEWSPSTLGLNFVGWGGIWSFRFLIYCCFLLVPVSLVRTSCWLKGKLFLKKFSFLLALAVDYSINASVHTQLSCVWVGTVWLQEFTYLLDRLDLSNVLHLVWSKCVSLTHLKIRLISISGALLGQKKKSQRKPTIQGDCHCQHMPSVDAWKTQQNPCNGISNWRAESHTTQRGQALTIFFL